MALSYQAKREWLLYFSNENNWKNIFDEEFAQKGPMRASRFFQAIGFQVEQWAHHLNNWHKPVPASEKSENLTKIIVAHDFCVEPSLKAHNRLSRHATSGGVLFKSWNDVTEFEGHMVATPKNFAHSAHQDNFKITTTSTSRDKIQAFSHIFNAAQRSDNISRVREPALQPYELIYEMRGGDVVQDHHNIQWLFRNFETPNAAQFAKTLRQSFMNALRIPHEAFFALSYDSTMSLAAVRGEAFATLDIDSTQRAIDAIEQEARNQGLHL